MVNCNPETVSTDYDTADRLYFEPLTFEDVLEVYRAEQGSGAGGPGVVGVIVQLGGQTPLGWRTARGGRCPIVGTSPRRSTSPRTAALRQVLTGAGCPLRGSAPPPASSRPEDRRDIGYPVLVRPSYVLGGRGMEIVYDERRCRATSSARPSSEHPVLVDRFLEDAIEIDVDALCDGTEVYIGGVMEHIEEAGIHSGDSACALPPVTLGRSEIAAVRQATEAIAHGVGVVGLLNVQYALKDDVLYVLEANRAPAGPCRSCPRPPRCRWPRLRPDHAGRQHRPAACRGHADRGRRRHPARTRRSRSRRPSCRSTGSAAPTARASTRSGRR
jgi:carbamoyl-phosphate synthase large subunit